MGFKSREQVGHFIKRDPQKPNWQSLVFPSGMGERIRGYHWSLCCSLLLETRVETEIHEGIMDYHGPTRWPLASTISFDPAIRPLSIDVCVLFQSFQTSFLVSLTQRWCSRRGKWSNYHPEDTTRSIPGVVKTKKGQLRPRLDSN